MIRIAHLRPVHHPFTLELAVFGTASATVDATSASSSLCDRCLPDLGVWPQLFRLVRCDWVSGGLRCRVFLVFVRIVGAEESVGRVSRDDPLLAGVPACPTLAAGLPSHVACVVHHTWLLRASVAWLVLVHHPLYFLLPRRFSGVGRHLLEALRMRQPRNSVQARGQVLTAAAGAYGPQAAFTAIDLASLR